MKAHFTTIKNHPNEISQPSFFVRIHGVLIGSFCANEPTNLRMQ